MAAAAAVGPAVGSSEPPSEPQNQLQVPSSSKESDVNPEDNEDGDDVLPDGMGESSVPPWLQAELDDEFIPMGSYVPTEPQNNSAAAAQPCPPAVSIPTKNDEPAPNRTKDSDSAFSHNGTHSSGYK